MEALRSENEELRANLAESRKYAQECEDESVDLRWQLLQANKEIKKLKKQADAAGLKFPVLSERDEQPPSAKKAAPSVPATPAATPAATPTVRTGRRAGLRSSSKAGLGEPFLELDLKSASKRKAQGDDEELRKTKRSTNKKKGAALNSAETCMDVMDNLLSLEAPWTERMTALGQVRDLVLKCCDSGLKLEDSFLERLEKALSTQLLDPRSQIVREVCNVTKSIADKMPEQFRAREIVGVLLKLTYVTIRAIAEPAAECLDSIVQVLPVSALIPELVVAMSDVHQQARIKAVQSVGSLIAKHKKDGGLDSHKESLKTIVISALNDLSADSRQKGKAVYAIVKEIWPATAKQILEQVKDKVREQLDGSADGQGSKDGDKKSVKAAGSSNRIDFKAIREAQRKKMLEAKQGKADGDVIVCAPRTSAMPKKTEEVENECEVTFAGGKSLARTPAKTPGKSLASKTPGKTPGKAKAVLESMNA